jgi:hypothetical protein
VGSKCPLCREKGVSNGGRFCKACNADVKAGYKTPTEEQFARDAVARGKNCKSQANNADKARAKALCICCKQHPPRDGKETCEECAKTRNAVSTPCALQALLTFSLSQVSANWTLAFAPHVRRLSLKDKRRRVASIADVAIQR